jgi:hypothetical protein
MNEIDFNAVSLIRLALYSAAVWSVVDLTDAQNGSNALGRLSATSAAVYVYIHQRKIDHDGGELGQSVGVYMYSTEKMVQLSDVSFLSDAVRWNSARSALSCWWNDGDWTLGGCAWMLSSCFSAGEILDGAIFFFL